MGCLLLCGRRPAHQGAAHASDGGPQALLIVPRLEERTPPCTLSPFHATAHWATSLCLRTTLHPKASLMHALRLRLLTHTPHPSAWHHLIPGLRLGGGLATHPPALCLLPRACHAQRCGVQLLCQARCLRPCVGAQQQRAASGRSLSQASTGAAVLQGAAANEHHLAHAEQKGQQRGLRYQQHVMPGLRPLITLALLGCKSPWLWRPKGHSQLVLGAQHVRHLLTAGCVFREQHGAQAGVVRSKRHMRGANDTLLTRQRVGGQPQGALVPKTSL
mmetsp:Transcript_26877/g.69286  ORF Transcript_26877/g.69286 Transcript_26877/m.69286 type:complete len:274 (-) Transcript_26877:409-1230(-)